MVRPVTMKVHMLLDATPVMTRWLEITNTGDQPAALSAVYPWSGVLKFSGQWGSHGVPVATDMSDLYSVGYMANSAWGDEGNFKWHSIPTAGYRVDGRYRRDRHRHPMFVLRNNATGEHFICQLAWSGGFSFEFDLDAPVGDVGPYSLFFRAGPDAPPPHRVIAPGETVTSPEVHLGMVFGDLDASIQAMHDHLRRSVFMPQPRGRGGWIESGIGPELEITTDYVFHQIENAAAWGSEVFFIEPVGICRRTGVGLPLSVIGRWTGNVFQTESDHSAIGAMNTGCSSGFGWTPSVLGPKVKSRWSTQNGWQPPIMANKDSVEC